ncbi:MAG: multiheme c-type cytochrome [Sulfuricellaceae bacterium]
MWRIGCVAAMLLALAGCNPNSAPGSASSKPIVQRDDHQTFLVRHWSHPLPLQGVAPGHFSRLEASLDPTSCGTCHPRQFEDWKTALHSRSMSPGLFGQLQQMGAEAADEHQACIQCHAPLAEQGEHLRKVLAGGKRLIPPRPDGISSAHGLSCAGCHARARQVYGPRRKNGTVPAPEQKLPHEGWRATNAFEDSRFCATCHQFESDGPALNGKLLENTYEEWRTSRHAGEKRTCQSCHMPDRRHLWRGIHDPEMVKSGLNIEASHPIVAKGHVSVNLQIANHGVGHAFPTYVTPRVIVEIGQESRNGIMIPGSIERHLIARDVSLDLQMEKADTRIMPDEVRRYGYEKVMLADAVALTIVIVVEPDAFYADFYRATLNDPEFRIGRNSIREALKLAERSSYRIFKSRQEIAWPTMSD